MSGPVRLTAGALSASLDGVDLVDLRWGGQPVADRILVTVRDPAWGTVPARLRSCTVERSPRGPALTLDAVHEDGGDVAFAWRARIAGGADGVLRFQLDGTAERLFAFRRIGICVLHPWRAYVGATYRATGGDVRSEGRFPEAIAPQPFRDGSFRPMIEAFTDLDVRFANGTGAMFAFSGDRFELEDQRNWTDASFKTYPTPLAASEPRTIRSGERIEQGLTVRLRGGAPPVIADPEETVVSVGRSTGLQVPPIGISVVDPEPRPAHLRVEIDTANADTAAIERAAGAGVPLEVALLVDADLAGIETLGPILGRIELARLLIQRADEATIDGALVASVLERLGVAIGGVQVVGGTRGSFSELNRHPPDGAGVDAIGFAISPILHATGERSMMQTLEIQGQVVRQAGRLARGLPIVASPVAIGEHRGTPFADAWTAGSVASLVSAGASSLTYAEPTRSLATAIALEGEELLDVTTDPPGWVAALATTTSVLLVNLTPREQPIRLSGGSLGPLGPYEVRLISAR